MSSEPLNVQVTQKLPGTIPSISFPAPQQDPFPNGDYPVSRVTPNEDGTKAYHTKTDVYNEVPQAWRPALAQAYSENPRMKPGEIEALLHSEWQMGKSVELGGIKKSDFAGASGYIGGIRKATLADYNKRHGTNLTADTPQEAIATAAKIFDEKRTIHNYDPKTNTQTIKKYLPASEGYIKHYYAGDTPHTEKYDNAMKFYSSKPIHPEKVLPVNGLTLGSLKHLQRIGALSGMADVAESKDIY